MSVIKVAQPGGDVTDADVDLAFTSERTCIVELFSGYIDITTDGSGYGTGEFDHNLSYRPGYYCYGRDPLATGEWYPHQSGSLGLVTKIDTTTLYMEIAYKEADSVYRVFYSVWGNQTNDLTGSDNDNITGVLKIAKAGETLASATDARQLTFFSGANVFKQDLALNGNASVAMVPPDIAEITVNHNLGYVPMAFVMFDDGAFANMLPSSQLFDLTYDYRITSTQLIIMVTDLSFQPNYTANFKYKILRDKIA